MGRLWIMALSVMAVLIAFTGVKLTTGTDETSETPVVVSPATDGVMIVSVAEPRPPLQWATLKWPLIAISVIVVLFVMFQQLALLLTPPQGSRSRRRRTTARSTARRTPPRMAEVLTDWTAPLPDYSVDPSYAGD